jgi:hypothetical protein
MDASAYKAGLAELRGLREDIKKVRTALKKLENQRDKQITALAAHDRAKAEQIAPAAGLSIADVVATAPVLAPVALAATSAPADAPASAAATAPTITAAPTTDLRPAQAPHAGPTAPPTSLLAPKLLQGEAHSEAHPVPTPALTAVPVPGQGEREAAPAQPPRPPSIPADAGPDWFTHTSGLVSTRPNYTQQARATVFLDTATGILAYRDQTMRLDLAGASAGQILNAVAVTVPGPVERIYITAGDPWHRDAARYPYLKDAVAAWLNAPTPGWRTDTGRGQDRMAGHFVHARNPVGRYMRDSGESHVEIRSVGEWFDPEGADPATVRDAFVLLWKNLRCHWPDAVIMGSPSQTGRDLWTRTIPTRGQYAEGYPVLSEELRGLLHSTAGQGRNELITPHTTPSVPEQLPALVEYDRTFAYAKHTWKSPVGTPRRITATTFASWSQNEQTKALFGCGHWRIRATVPDNWNHVGLLPAPAPGDRAWHYPATPGTTFTTWAGGPEVHTALTNPLSPWKIEILDGILWEEGKPLDDWAKNLKDAWAALDAQAALHTDPRQARAAHLASRAVRAILLYGIGSFAQRPRMVTGTTPRALERDVPADAEIISFDDQQITWQKPTGFSRDSNAHPEWSAAIWSAARAALLIQRHRDEGAFAGALHVPPGTVVAFRTDALYLTGTHPWPYHRQPGDYLLKGHLVGPLTAPTSEEELLSLREVGRTSLAGTRAGARV